MSKLFRLKNTMEESLWSQDLKIYVVYFNLIGMSKMHHQYKRRAEFCMSLRMQIECSRRV